MPARSALLFVVFACSSPALSLSADWPQFRGPAGDNIASTAPPTEWSETEHVAWSVDLPGAGWSCPIVTGGLVFLTSAAPVSDGEASDAYRFEVHCFDLATGDRLWARTAAEQAPRVPIHRDNSHATETAVTDGRRVIAYFGMTGCFCYSLDGDLLWKKELGAFPLAHDWGASSSPTIGDGLVYLQIDNEERSHVVALDVATGDQRWRAERPEEKTNWCTPLLWRNSKQTELVTGGKTVRSYNAATGELLWSMPIGGRSAATASAVGDTLIIGSENRVRNGGSPGGLFAVKAGAVGELDVLTPGASPPEVIWSNLQGAIGISSPLVFDGLVYAPARRAGVVVVHDLQTGEVVRKGRIRGAGKLWASPWSAAGRLFFLDEQGKTFVLKPGPGLEVEQTNPLPGRFWSSPAVAGDTLVVRSEQQLFAIR